MYVYIYISVYMYRCIFMHTFCNPQDDQRNSAAARPRGATDHHRATRQRCAVECRYFIYTHKYSWLYMYTHIRKRQRRCEHLSKHGWRIAVSIARSTAMVMHTLAHTRKSVAFRSLLPLLAPGGAASLLCYGGQTRRARAENFGRTF